MKRKQSATSYTKSKKRAKGQHSSPHPHGVVDPGKEYKLRSILDERGGKYLIDWEDDEITGERYSPTWEPKAFANQQAVDDWAQQNAPRAAASAPPPPPATPSTPAIPTRKARGRPRKIVESSPETSPKLVRAQPPHQLEPQEPKSLETQDQQPEPEIIESQPAVEDVADSPLFEPAVELPEPPSSYRDGEYQKFSSSQLVSASDSAPPATVTASQGQSRSVPVNFGDGSSRVIPDSQTLVEFSSSAPAATTSSHSAPQASTEEPVAETPAAASRRSTPAAGVTELVVPPDNIHTEPPHTQIDLSNGDTPGSQERRVSAEPTSLESKDSPIRAGSGRATAEATPVVQSATLHEADTPAAVGERRPPESLEQHPVRQNLTPNAHQLSPVRSGLTETSSFPFQTQLGPRPSSSGSLIRPFSAYSDRATSLPVGKPSPVRFSSPLESVPAYSVEIGASAPARPSTPSNHSRAMDTTSPDSVDAKKIISEKLKAIREQPRAPRHGSVPTSAPSQHTKPAATSQPSDAGSVPVLSQPPRLVSSLLAEEQDRRSPSAVPAMEPAPVITQEEMNTSERYETLVPQSQGDFLEGARNHHGSITLSRQQFKAERPHVSLECIVPIAVLGHQRDQYFQTIVQGKNELCENNEALIKRFLASYAPDADLSREAERFVTKLHSVILHPDLTNVETFTQYDVSPSQQAQWDVDCSAKFRFLKALFEGLRDQSVHVAIVMKPGRILAMLRTFFTAIKVPHRTLDEVVDVHMASEQDGVMVTLVSTNDEVPETQPSPADLVIALHPTDFEESTVLRSLLHSGEKRPPVITLVVPYSIEHIETSISAGLQGHARLRTIISGAYKYRHDAGKLEQPDMEPKAAAQAVAQFLIGEPEAEWPLDSIGALDDLDSQTDSDSSTKRPLQAEDDDAEDLGNKRRRTDQPREIDGLPTTINPQDIEITHVSESEAQATQDTKHHLRRLLQEAQGRLDEHVQALSELQYRHEEQRHELVEITKQRDAAADMAQNAVTRMTEFANNNSTLKGRLTEAAQQLQEANAKLLDHSVPEQAAFEALRLAGEKANEEKQQLEKRLERANNDLEYTRSMYQNASQSAQGLASQTTELENEVAVLKNKATGEQARLRHMGFDAHSQNLRAENRKLKAVLKDREAALKFRDEEIAKLKEASRGRMGTRGTSVPRSPRLGSPMKMGARSRQGSPAAGDLRGKAAAHLHPLRNG